MNLQTIKIYELYKEWGIKVAAGVGTFFVCYFIMIHPVFRDIATLHQDIKDSEKRRELYRDVQGKKEYLEKSEVALATATDRSQILGKISDIASRSQLHVETLTPRTESAGGYTRLKMEMEGQGSFFSLLKFLREVEKNASAIKIRDLSMLWKPSPDRKENKFPLQIQLMFETLLIQRAPKTNA